MPDTIKAGSVVLARGGCSRDWRPLGVFRALHNLHVPGLRAEWVESLPAAERAWAYRYAEDFLAWLVDVRGVFVEVPAVELTVESFTGADCPQEPDKAKPFLGIVPLMLNDPRTSDLEVRIHALDAEIQALLREAQAKREELGSLMMQAAAARWKKGKE